MYWKQCVALGTAWLHRYRDDPFFRTEVNIIALQIAFALIILGLVGTSYSFLNRDVANAIVAGIRASSATTSPADIAPTVVNQIQAIRGGNLAMIAAVIVCATIIFGYIIARITLAPTRNALASQKQFIGNVAHELRTPLSIIKTNTEIALLDDRMSADLKQTLTSNVEELDRISEIINNLLSLSALIRPERVEFSSVDMGDVVDAVVQKFGSLARTSGHEITVRKSPDMLVWGNSTALEQIAGNLLKNAINYTPRHGTITLTVNAAPRSMVELIIQDSGVGISRKDLFRIFEPFYRADPSRTRGQGGSGLGLAIVSELIKLHHGKITIRSAVGRGTTVSILFPGARTQARVGSSERVEGLNEIAVDFSTNQG